MKILLDMNLSPVWVPYLQNGGHEAKQATAIYSGLETLAEEKGQPDTVSHAELSRYIVGALIIAPVLKTVQSSIRMNQTVISIIAAMGLLIATVAGSSARRGGENRRKASRFG